MRWPFLLIKPGDDLLSHGETPHYHRRGLVSLPSSRWDRVVPRRYDRRKLGGYIAHVLNLTVEAFV